MINALYDFVRMDKQNCFLLPKSFKFYKSPVAVCLIDLLFDSHWLLAHCESSIFTYWTPEEKDLACFHADEVHITW